MQDSRSRQVNAPRSGWCRRGPASQTSAMGSSRYSERPGIHPRQSR
jgi:hypothetical protein